MVSKQFAFTLAAVFSGMWSCGCGAQIDARSQARMQAETYVREGRSLTAEQAQALEQKLKDSPDDVVARHKLLGYYFAARIKDRSTRGAAIPHVLWLIEHHPDSVILGLPYGEVDAILHPVEYAAARGMWLKHLDGACKENVVVIGNAASFFTLHDSALAASLFRRAAALEPKEARWEQELGHLASLQVWRKGNAPDPEAAREAMQAYERAMALQAAAERETMLIDVATASLYAGESQKAEGYAKEILKRAETGGIMTWNLGNAIHHGNLVLGHVSLRAGRIDEAEQYLLKAGKTPGSPQLDSFGPNMYLAQEMFRKGRKDTVVQYLKQCKTFWKEPELDGWIRDVEQGRTPDFSSQLHY